MPILITCFRNGARNFWHKQHIELQVSGSGNPLVQINPHMLQRILFNLVKNACEAFPEAYSGPKRINIVWSVAPQHLKLQVHDTGAGMPGEVLEKVFVSGYSTKSQHGRGLGLTSVQHMVNEKQGQLTIQSQNWETLSGTLITVTLPIA